MNLPEQLTELELSHWAKARKAGGIRRGQEECPGGTLVDHFLPGSTSDLESCWVQHRPGCLPAMAPECCRKCWTRPFSVGHRHFLLWHFNSSNGKLSGTQFLKHGESCHQVKWCCLHILFHLEDLKFVCFFKGVWTAGHQMPAPHPLSMLAASSWDNLMTNPHLSWCIVTSKLDFYYHVTCKSRSMEALKSAGGSGKSSQGQQRWSQQKFYNF